MTTKKSAALPLADARILIAGAASRGLAPPPTRCWPPACAR
ncbi:hypothetical protein WJ967_07305 [Achromobacter xylosoxidans]